MMAGLTVLVLFHSEKSSAQKSKSKIVLTWETPEEGTAVNFNSEEEYLSAEPVLRSTGGNPTIKIQLDMTPDTRPSQQPPKLQKVILPGSPPENADDDVESDEHAQTNDDDIGKRAAQKAREFYENKVKTVRVNGSLLNIETDCSFFVRAAYWEASDHTRDLFKESIATKSIDPRKATGVIMLARFFEKNHRYTPDHPKIGDVIIFDNTYDKNHNQVRDDYYTHTGIVTGIRKDKTIEFIHGNIGRTIKMGYINLNHKDSFKINGQAVNSYIRPKYSWEKNPEQNLSSHLVRAFGGI